jgi:8-oxo-dGTP diphosphatase
MAKGKRIEAAGGVILRPGPGGDPEVAIVHRPRYDDWSLPKGKLEGGESFRQAAKREVEEETGYRCRLGRELPANSYRDHKDRRKEVRWWLMSPIEGSFEANDEVDELRWLPVGEASEAVDYDHARALLEGLVGRDS